MGSLALPFRGRAEVAVCAVDEGGVGHGSSGLAGLVDSCSISLHACSFKSK